MKQVFIHSLCLFFFMLLLSHPGHTQTSRIDSIILKNRLKVDFRLDVGNVMPTNDFVRKQNTDLDGLAHYYGYSLRLARQTTGDKLWQQLYDYPTYGLGVYSAFFANTNNLGHPVAVYGFLNAPFFKIRQLSLNYELGLGFTFNWDHFDPVSNPNNVAISADGSVYIDAGVSINYPATKRLTLNLGYGFTHFSNGALKLPNKGLNTGATKISLSYNLFDDPIRYTKQQIPPFSGHYEWILSAYGGARNMLYTGTGINVATEMKGLNFAVYGISNTLNRQISYKSKIGIGLTMEYNGSQNSQIVVEGTNLDELDLPFDRHLSVSIYPSYELVVDKLSLVIQPGFYLFRKKSADMTPAYYQRIGVKYHFLKNTFLGINLRAYNFYESDFIEWTIGHRLCW